MTSGNVTALEDAVSALKAYRSALRESQQNIVACKRELARAIADAKIIRQDIRFKRSVIRDLRDAVRTEKKNAIEEKRREAQLRKIVLEDQRDLRRNKRIEKLAERLAAERMKAMSVKARKRAARKASDVTIIEVA